MNLFKIVKESVTVKQTAALYGLPVTTTWMTRCPFHEDHTPSMKLNDTYYYCFGCGATGDVIDLTAQLFGLSSFQAARKLTQDFGLSPDKPPSGAVALPKPAAASSDTQQEEIFYCLRVLHDYRDADPVANRVCSPLPGGTAGRAFCRGSAHDGRCGRPY